MGTTNGCDWSGHIVKLGTKASELHATSLKIGDHVAGFTQGGTDKDHGAFAEYLKAAYDLSLRHTLARESGCDGLRVSFTYSTVY